MPENKLTEVVTVCCYKSEALLLTQQAEQRFVTRSKLIRALAVELLSTPGSVVSSALQEATNDKLTTVVATRMSEKEFVQLSALAETMGMSVSRLIRRQIPRADLVNIGRPN